MQTTWLGPPPDNDDCPDAFAFFGRGTEAFSNLHWVTDGFPEPGLCAGEGQVYRDGWYEYLADCTGVAKLTVEGDFGARILVYRGTCDDLVPLACSGDTGCAGSSAVVTFPVVAGESFIVRVGGCTEADAGVASLSADCQLAPTVPALPAGGLVLLAALLTSAGAVVLRRR